MKNLKHREDFNSGLHNYSISPLPISYKQENLELLFKIKTRTWKYRKHHGDTQRLVIHSLLERSKTLSEISRELCMPPASIKRTIQKLSMVMKMGEIELRRGGYAKANLFGIKDIKRAQDFLNKK